MFVVLSIALVLVVATWPLTPAALKYLWGNGKGPFTHRYEVVKFHQTTGQFARHGVKRFRTLHGAIRHDRRMNRLYQDARKKFRVPEIEYFYTVKPLVALT